MKKLINFFLKFYSKLKEEDVFFFFFSSCIFYFGFVFGNIFIIFLNFLRNKIIWGGTMLIIIILFSEVLNQLIYSNEYSIIKLKNKKLLKSYQMGFLLGLFIDAFKIGS